MKDFEFSLNGTDYRSNIDNTMVCMFRKQPYMDYFKVILEEDEKLFVFNNPELARRLGGFALTSELNYANDLDFRREYSWNAITIIEDTARDYEVDLYVQANINDLEDLPEWLK